MNEIDFLRKKIEETGYPLEIEISSFLDKVWYSVRNTDTYYDREGKTLRDIDICATDYLETKKTLPISLTTNLVIECKKERDFAWVFFTRPIEEVCIDDINGQYTDKIQSITKSTDNDQILHTIFFNTNLHYLKFERTAVTYDAFNLRGKKSAFEGKKRGIFEAQNQLKKYVSWIIEQLIETDLQHSVYPIQMSFPCIVFDGLMYEAIIENGRMQLKKSDHIVLDTLYKSSYSIYEKGVLIDVVTKSYFENYQKQIRKDVAALRKTVRRFTKKFTRETEKVMLLFSSTEKRTVHTFK